MRETKKSRDGRDSAGLFVRGNKYGGGDPHRRKTCEWRRALAETITVADLVEVVKLLVSEAKAGRRWAIIEVLNRTLGGPPSAGEIDLRMRFDALEAQLDQRDADGGD